MPPKAQRQETRASNLDPQVMERRPSREVISVSELRGEQVEQARLKRGPTTHHFPPRVPEGDEPGAHANGGAGANGGRRRATSVRSWFRRLSGRGSGGDASALAEARAELVAASAERDQLRRERDQFERMSTDFRRQLLEERTTATGGVQSPHAPHAKRPSIVTADALDHARLFAVAAEASDEERAASLAEAQDAIHMLFDGLEVIASDLYVHEVVGRVIHITTRILCCERVTLFSADESRRELAVYLSADGLTTLTVPYERGLVGAAAATKKVLNIEDAYQDPRFNQEVDTETGFRTKAVLCCPMIDPKGNLVAVLQAINPLHGGTFSDRDLRLIRCMQMPLAIALLNARLHSSLRNANESSATLVRVANALHSELTSVTSGSSGATQGSLNSLMDKVVREAKERFAADRCSMYVCDASRNEIWSLVAMGLTERFRVPIGKGIAGRCAETGEAINVVDASSDARVFKTDIGGYVMRNTLCVPIIDRRETLADGRPKIIGVVQLLNKLKAPNHFTLQDEEALEGFCNIVGLAMQNAITFDAVREKEETTSHILSSISSYICKFSLNGRLEWCNQSEALEKVMGVPTTTMRATHFGEWVGGVGSPSKSDRGGKAKPLLLRQHLTECLDKGSRFAERDVKIRPAATDDDDDAPFRFFTYKIAPLFHKDALEDSSEEKQVGALLVLEDVSETHARIEMEAKLSDATRRMSKLQSELAALQMSSAQVSETPLQRAIDVVKQLMTDQPEIRSPLQDILTQLTSRDVLAPSILTDQRQMDQMDKFTRDFLGGLTESSLKTVEEETNEKEKARDASFVLKRRTSTSGGSSEMSPVPWRRISDGEAREGGTPPGERDPVRAAIASAEKRRAENVSPSEKGERPHGHGFFRRKSLPGGAALGATFDSLAAGKLPGRRSEDKRASLPEVLTASPSGGREVEKDKDELAQEAAEARVATARLKLAPADWRLPSSPALGGDNLVSWELDLYTCRERAASGAGRGASATELLGVAHGLLSRVQIAETLGVDDDVVKNFVIAISQGYLDVPFHNFSHGVYVLQGCVIALERCARLQQILRPLDKLALCVAALGHDIGHLGVQNSFLVNSNDPLALQYNDRSVLESMHCWRLFRVLRMGGCGLFNNLAVEEYREVRKMMIGAILATDLSNHFADLGKFRTRMASDDAWSDALGDRQMALDMVLHASDLSGPARPWKVSSVWAGKVSEEFEAQLAAEKRLGIPVSTFLDAPKPKLELEFMKVFANPTWAALANFLPEMQDRVDDMAANHAEWTRQLRESERGSATLPGS